MFSQISRKRRRLALTCSILVCCMLTACSKQAPRTDTPTVAKATQPLSVLAPVSFNEWQKIQQSVAPDILVVDLWATWCVPCLERFPHMVELSQRYQDRGVAFLSLSLDDREDEAALAFGKEFLNRQQADFAHYLLDEDLLDGFEKIDLQTVPAVDVYDRTGKLHVRFTGDNPNKPFDEEDIADSIENLLQER